MKQLNRPSLLGRLLQLLRFLSSSDLPTLLAEASKISRALGRLLSRYTSHDCFEVLERQTTLELCDPAGEKAIVRHRKRIRFLQDSVSAITDRVWGGGHFCKQYTCSPGKAVDFYEAGSRWNVLISLRETKRRGDILTLKTSRVMQDAFINNRTWWEAEIYQPTRSATVTIIFPKGKRCQRATVTQRSRNHTVTLGRQHFHFLSDGRQVLTWKTRYPKLHDLYRIQWSW